MGYLAHTIALAVFVGLPFADSLAKRAYVDARCTQLGRTAGLSTAEFKHRRWKPHKQLRSVWSLIYVLEGLAAWRVWCQGGLIAQAYPLSLFLGLLAANWLCWPPLFFGGHSMRFACLDTAVLGLASATTISTFYKADAWAGVLLFPFLAWTCFATTLINSSLLSSNPLIVASAQRLAALKPFASVSSSQSQPSVANKPEAAGHAGQGVPMQPDVDAATALDRRQPEGGVPCSWQRKDLRVRAPSAKATELPESAFASTEQQHLSPLQQAKELLNKMTESLTSDEYSPDMVKSSIVRISSLLNRVSSSLAATAEAFAETPLASVGSMLCRMSMSLSRGLSQEVTRWPFSDSIPTTYFACPGPAGFRVRGGNYLKDRKKEVPDKCQAKLVSLNLVSIREPTFHIARFLPSIRDSKAPFMLVWQVMVPGKMHLSLTIAWALEYDPVAAVAAAAKTIPEDEAFDEHQTQQRHQQSLQEAASPSPGRPPMRQRSIDLLENMVERSAKSLTALQLDRNSANAPKAQHRRASSVVDMSARPPSPRLQEEAMPLSPSAIEAPKGVSPFDLTVARFLDDSGTEAEVTARRHSMFKIIPRVEKGGWVVKQAVGQNTPVLLGRKLTTKYFRGARYLEVDVDVGSSRTAASVVGLVQGAITTLVVDIAVLLEGHEQEELPEALLGTVRLDHLDLSKAAHLDIDTGVISNQS